MFLLIVATIINCANSQVAAPIQKPSSEQSNQNNQNSTEKKIGKTLQEEYTDSEGNIKTRSYRYGFQYKDSFKPAKPSGSTLKESYTNQSGDQNSRSYRYGWQYKSDDTAEEKPIKLKAPKWNTAPAENAGENAGSAVSSESTPTSSSASAPTTSLAPSGDDIKKKDADILNRMKDLIKERQQLKTGK